MVPSLAHLSKECLPGVIEDCLPLIQQYAVDRRAPHPVALLVKNINAYWFGRFNRYFFLNNHRAGGNQCFSYNHGNESGEFTTESMQRLYKTNKRKRRDAQLDADSHNNSRDESTKIHPFFRHMQQEMQSCRYRPGSLSSLDYYAPVSYPSNTWPARGWNGSKRPCKRPLLYGSICRNYITDIPVTDSDSD